MISKVEGSNVRATLRLWHFRIRRRAAFGPAGRGYLNQGTDVAMKFLAVLKSRFLRVVERVPVWAALLLPLHDLNHLTRDVLDQTPFIRLGHRCGGNACRAGLTHCGERF
jgi:hypothetical protein